MDLELDVEAFLYGGDSTLMECDDCSRDVFAFDNMSATPNEHIDSRNSFTMSAMERDLEGILENYLFELNTIETQQHLVMDINTYFANTWTDYTVHEITVEGNNHDLSGSVLVGKFDITSDYRIDDFNIHFEITDPDMGNFAAFMKEWADSAEPYVFADAPDPVMESAEDILFSVVKKS